MIITNKVSLYACLDNILLRSYLQDKDRLKIHLDSNFRKNLHERVFSTSIRIEKLRHILYMCERKDAM